MSLTAFMSLLFYPQGNHIQTNSVGTTATRTPGRLLSSTTLIVADEDFHQEKEKTLNCRSYSKELVQLSGLKGQASTVVLDAKGGQFANSKETRAKH